MSDDESRDFPFSRATRMTEEEIEGWRDLATELRAAAGVRPGFALDAHTMIAVERDHQAHDKQMAWIGEALGDADTARYVQQMYQGYAHSASFTPEALRMLLSMVQCHLMARVGTKFLEIAKEVRKGKRG